MVKKIEKKQISSLIPRSPVVVILGHVDHGKTSLLDYIRKTKVTEQESGGITQHIGAYQITLPPAEAMLSQASQETGEGSPPKKGKILPPRSTAAARDDFAPAGRKITFIDTPGHEAFSAMRSRGAKVADIAILVVAADEGVKPQTKEAIAHIKKAGLAVIAAITKIDNPNALPEKVRAQLMEEGLLLESRGGDVPEVLVSSKTGQGIDDLLELILLVAEMKEIKSDPSVLASGVVIEAYQDAHRGPTATLLVKEGSLKLKDIICTESTCGTTKRMEDWQGNIIQKAEASQPVVIIGLENVPLVGEKWKISESLDIARETAAKKGLHEQKKRTQAEVLDIGPDKKVLNIILKTDVLGSLGAIKESLQTIKSEEIILRILKAEVGDISESDIKLAESARATIVGFRVKSSNIYNQMAEQKNVQLLIFEVIYELIQKIREAMSDLLEPEIVRVDLAKLKVIALFKKNKEGQIVGAKVLSGKIEKGLWVEVIRNEEVLGRGKVGHLQYEKKEADTVGVGKNAGILFRGNIDIELDDILMAYREERKRRTL